MAKAKTAKRSVRKPAQRKPAQRKVVPRKAAPAKWSEPQKRDYDAIRTRVDALGKAPEGKFDAEGNPVGAWAEALAALDAWAKKHKVKQTTHEVEHVVRKKEAETTPGMPVPGWEPCQASTNRPGPYVGQYTHCTLRRQRQRLIGGGWVCRYSCEVAYGPMPKD